MNGLAFSFQWLTPAVMSAASSSTLTLRDHFGFLMLNPEKPLSQPIEPVLGETSPPRIPPQRRSPHWSAPDHSPTPSATATPTTVPRNGTSPTPPTPPARCPVTGRYPRPRAALGRRPTPGFAGPVHRVGVDGDAQQSGVERREPTQGTNRAQFLVDAVYFGLAEFARVRCPRPSFGSAGSGRASPRRIWS